MYLVPFLAFLVAPASADPTVTMPLAQWERLTAPPSQQQPGQKHPGHLNRQMDVRYERGVVSVSFDWTVDVGPEGALLPAVPRGAVLSALTVDGRTHAAVLSGAWYHVRLGAGSHRVTAEYVEGTSDDRYARRISMKLPAGGPIAMELTIAEPDIEARLTGGQVVRQRHEAQGTHITAFLDGSGEMGLTWERKLHTGAEQARITTDVYAVMSLGEPVVGGVVRMDLLVSEGELDEVTMSVPEGVEIREVSGADVLQWHLKGGSEVRVLLRRAVRDRTSLSVKFQAPRDLDQPVPVAVPLPMHGEVRGFVGVEAPVGLDATLGTGEGEIARSAVPEDLVALSTRPVLMAMAFDEDGPNATLNVKRQGHIRPPKTLSIDDMQALTVVLEDGSVVSKVRLRIRNTHEQHLSVTLPADAQLTHCLVDGVPVRPALEGDTLLIPLLASETTETTYTVQYGDTLGGISQRFYGSSGSYGVLLSANRGSLGDADQLSVGTALRIPPKDVSSGDVRDFGIEFAWREQREVSWLGWGRTEVALAEMDAEMASANWHLYLPSETVPLQLDSNMVQVSRRHSGVLHGAARWLLSGVSSVASAGGGYENILSSRKAIYRSESSGRQFEQMGSAFPLVGEKYRFRRLLLGKERAVVDVLWVNPLVANAARLAAMGLAAAAGAAVALRRSKVAFAGAGVAVFTVLFAANYLMGLNGALIDGLLAGVVGAAVWRWRSTVTDQAVQTWREPWRILQFSSWAGVVALSGLTAAVLFFAASEMLAPLMLLGAAYVAAGWGQE